MIIIKNLRQDYLSKIKPSIEHYMKQEITSGERLMKLGKRFHVTHKQSTITKSTLCNQVKKLQIADLESQKEIIQSYQSTWAPYIENMHNAFWNNWASPQRAAEIYARTVSNFADNVMAASRVTNNTLFMNIGAYKTFVQREKDDVKEFSRMAANTARTFENNSKEFVPNNRPA